MVVEASPAPTWSDISEYDSNADGNIHTQEFQAYLDSRGIKPGTAVYEKAMQAFHLAAGDHSLSETEFGKVPTAGDGSAHETFGNILADAITAPEPTNGLTSAQNNSLTSLDNTKPPSFSFSDMDLDGTGGVTDAEFRAYLEHYGILSGTPESDAAWAWFGQAKGDGNGKAVNRSEFEALPPPATLTSMEILGDKAVFGTDMSDPNQIGEGDNLNGYTFKPGQTTWQTPSGKHHFVGIDDNGQWIDLGETIDGRREQVMHASFVAFSQSGFSGEAWGSGAVGDAAIALAPYVLELDKNNTTGSDVAAGSVTPPPPPSAGGRVLDPTTVPTDENGNVAGGRLENGNFVGVNGNGEFIDLGPTLSPNEVEPWLFAQGKTLADLKKTNGEFDIGKLLSTFAGVDHKFDRAESVAYKEFLKAQGIK